MADSKEVLVPDVGGEEVEVIEIIVSKGDSVDAEDGLITVESDKASMDIPAPFAGKVSEIKVSVGDKISEGDLIAMIEAGESSDDDSDDDGDDSGSSSADADAEKSSDDGDDDVARSSTAGESSGDSDDHSDKNGSDSDDDDKEGSAPKGSDPDGDSKVIDVKVPDIGDDGEVDVIEVLVSVGDTIEKEDGLITLETDKATMDVPSPEAGTVKSVEVSTGDKVKEGSLVITLAVARSSTAGVLQATKSLMVKNLMIRSRMTKRLTTKSLLAKMQKGQTTKDG